MKSILYIHHTSVIGGASYCLLSVLKEVDQTRYIPTVLLKEQGPLVQEIEKLGINVEFLSSMTAVPYNRSLLRWSSIKTWLAVNKSKKMFKEWLKGKNFDVIYVNSMMLHPYLIPAKEVGIKTILHVREYWPKNENQLQLDYAIRNISQNADCIISINKHSAKLFDNVKEKVCVVYDWIDFSQRYEPRPYKDIFGEDYKKLKVFLYTGGMQRIKGAYEVVDVFTKYLKDENFRLLILGVDRQKSTSGIKGKIKLFLEKFGIKSYEYKVKDIINSDSRIVCIPATYKIKDIVEQAYCVINYFTRPHANLILAESVILKTVVCVAETPESLEYSNGGELAKLFPFKDKNGFVKTLKQIDKNYAEIKMRLEKDSNTIEELFDRKRNAQILSNIYKKITEE